MEEKLPEVVEVTATGKSEEGREKILDKIAEVLYKDDYVRISRGSSDEFTTDTHQHERVKDDT